MKKAASDQQFHDRRYQERKRAEAEKKPAKQKTTRGGSAKPAHGSSEKSPI